MKQTMISRQSPRPARRVHCAAGVSSAAAAALEEIRDQASGLLAVHAQAAEAVRCAEEALAAAQQSLRLVEYGLRNIERVLDAGTCCHEDREREAGQ